MPFPVIDVEATGPHPVEYSMIQIGLTDEKGNFFVSKMRPREGTTYDPRALEAIGVTWEETLTWPNPSQVMWDFREFLLNTYGRKRVVSWSDNPAFDWQFINAYLHMYCGENPLGWSMRRIGDLHCGAMGNLHAGWKHLRDTKHTHDALDDARGNSEALTKIRAML